MLSNGITLLAASLAAVAGVSASSPPRAIHRELSKRADSDVQLHKRHSDTRWTFFDVGLGACGEVNVESDFIVALNAEQFGSGYPGPNCGKTITMTYNGKTTQAKIMDRCPGCPYGGLDLSRSLFRYFAAESVGVIHGDWEFGSSSGGGAAPAPAPTSTKQAAAPKPTTSSTKAPAPSPSPVKATPAPAPSPAVVTSSTRAAQTPQSSPAKVVAPSPARVAPSPSVAPAPSSSTHSSSGVKADKPKTTFSPPQVAVVTNSIPTPSSSAAASPSASSLTASVTKSASSATVTSDKVSSASVTSTKASSTGSSSSTASSTASSAAATPTDPVTLIQNNIEAISYILSRLSELLEKLRLSKDN